MTAEFLKKRSSLILILFLFLGFSSPVICQEKQVNENTQLIEDIMAAYKSGGEQGLRHFMKKKKDKISNKFIVDFARVGFSKRKGEWLNVCKIMAEDKKDEKTLADVLCTIGIYFGSISYNKKADDYFDKALLIYQKLNDPVGQGKVYLSKGGIYLEFGKNSRALDMFDKALFFFEKVGKHVGQKNVYYYKGKICSKTGKDSRDIGKLDEALRFFKKADRPLEQGNVYMLMGDIYLTNGDIFEALKRHNEALTIFEKTGHRFGQGNAYLGKGKIYSRIGENKRSLDMFGKALDIFEKEGNQAGQGNVYQCKGDIYSVKGKNKKALEMYDKALPFFEKAGKIAGQGNVYLSIGEIHSKNNKNSSALAMYDKALPFFEKAGQIVGQGNVHLSIGKVYSKTGKYSRADKMFEEALPFFKKAGDIMSESNALCGQAKASVKLGKKKKALGLYEEAIAKLETVRTQTAVSGLKMTFMEMACKRYAEITQFMLENKYYEKGFKYAEAMRARVFLDQVAEGSINKDWGKTPEQKERLKQLDAEISSLTKKMHKNDGNNEEKYKEFKEKRSKVKNDYDELKLKIRLNNPAYKRFNPPKPITLRDLQTKVLKDEELLLQYFISPKKLYVFIISRESFRVVPLAFEENDIQVIEKDFLPAVKEKNWSRIKRFGKTLYEKLFKPLEKDLKKDKDIIIIPDGELAKIPFESLVTRKNESALPVFLLEKYKIKYIQSASVLSEMRANSLDRRTKSFIGFGDPVYDYDNFKQDKPDRGAPDRSTEKRDEIRDIHRSSYTRAGGIMSRLCKSKDEVEAIANLFIKKNQKYKVHLREEASEDNAKKLEIKDFNFIHFACHGLVNDDYQSLLLSQLPPDESPEDGYFTLNEIMNCEYRADMVVFSACQTGTGKIVKGEGITGLTTAVMCTGAEAVVASLWNAEDNATKELMVNFYSNILEKDMNKTDALRQAKLELIKKGRYCDPFYWSAFLMYGE